jgi:putative transposase
MLSQSKLGYKRGGKRMMNANASTSDVSLRSLRASVPFERAHLDHHLVKVFVKWGVDSENEYTARMWITVIIDEATDDVLAWHFTFSSPSRYSLGAVIRDCVRRHGKLPEELVVDHGPDMKAVYFRALAAHYGVILTYRPKSKGASGSTVENFFKEFQDGWLCAAPGNMVDKPASRSVDGNVSARNTAEYSIHDLISEFDKYVSYRSAKLRGVRTETSSKQFDELHALYPMVGRAVKYDKDFLVATAIEQKEYTIERNCVKIDETRYSNTELIKLQQSNKKVEVRADPENPYLAYAWVERRWIDCGATGIVEFLQKTSYERMIQAIKIRGASHLRGEARKSAMDRLAGKISDAAKIRASENRIANEVVMVEPDEIKDRASSIFDDLGEGFSDSALQTDKW